MSFYIQLNPQKLRKDYIMHKKIQIGLSLFVLLNCCAVFAQSSRQYKELLTKTQNHLFPKTLIYDAPSLPISYQDYIKFGFDYISVYSMNNPKSVPNRYKYLLWRVSSNGESKMVNGEESFVGDIGQYARRWNNRLNYYKNICKPK